ncbi:putative inorganic carbon (hco3(-)) transporter [Caloramator quimbayensis]|uniref:Putative inorganic carbon (Hco3(-)) transporter n=1 Tax=Caloramator quimbayensis TaxID=1147123 RepID=A0A1T4WWA9_9CLOT|nr:putative inorganic carbon (hco3(-)) transporter [Caloramator quimbayensis]
MKQLSKKIFNIFIICIICIVPLIITPNRLDYYYQAKSYLIYALCLFTSIPFLFEFNKDYFSNKAIYYTIFVYIFILALSTIFSVNISQSIFGKIYRYEGFLTLICYLIIFIIASSKYIFSKVHLVYLFLSATVISIYGILQYFGYNIVKVDPIRSKWVKYVYSTIGNPNFLGSYLVLILPISIYCFIKSNKILNLLITCLLYTTLLLTNTRSAWIGFALSFLLLVIFSIKNKKDLKSLIFILLIIFSITLLINSYKNNALIKRFDSIVSDAKNASIDSTKSEYSGSTRIFIWKRTLKLIQNSPIIGYGPDTFDIVFMKNYKKDVNRLIGNIIIDKAHNEYLQIAYASGIPALITYLLFLIFAIIDAIKNINKNILIIPLLCSISGYLIQSFFNISVVSVAPVFWAFLGILCKFSKVKEFH